MKKINFLPHSSEHTTIYVNGNETQFKQISCLNLLCKRAAFRNEETHIINMFDIPLLSYFVSLLHKQKSIGAIFM